MSEQPTPTQRVEKLFQSVIGFPPEYQASSFYEMSKQLATELEQVKEKNAEPVKDKERLDAADSNHLILTWT